MKSEAPGTAAAASPVVSLGDLTDELADRPAGSARTRMFSHAQPARRPGLTVTM